MTGFAREEGSLEGQSWVVETKSVNGRSLDIRFRLPTGMDELEASARAAIAERFRRGSVNLSVTLDKSDDVAQLRINRPFLDQVLRLARELEAAGAAVPRLDSLLGVRGVIEAGTGIEEDPAARQTLMKAVAATVVSALDRLAQARAEEGGQLDPILSGHLDQIEHLVEQAFGIASLQPELIRERLQRQIAQLLDQSARALPEDRLLQEVALLIVRVDVREELDRLRAHIAAAKALLAEGTAVGRRLDFLCQEFSREANTLCSKSSDLQLTQIGLALKAVIEQFREQVQNIE